MFETCGLLGNVVVDDSADWNRSEEPAAAP